MNQPPSALPAGADYSEGEIVRMKKMIVVDRYMCVGCKLCELACSGHKTGQFRPSVSRIKVSSNSRIGISTPSLCHQCEFPWCAAACKFEAIHINHGTGVVEIKHENCTGCKACTKACPYGAMGFDADANYPFKCDLCGGEPPCIASCRPRALRLIEYNDITQ